MTRRAEQVVALLARELDPEVDAQALFVIDLSDPTWAGKQGLRFIELLRGLDAPEPEPEAAPKPSRRRRKPKVEPAPEPEPQTEVGPDLTGLAPAAALEAAYLAFLRLPAAQRAERLATHAQRRADAVDKREAKARAKVQLERTQRLADQLEAYLDRKLDISVEPESLLTVDLIDTADVGLSSARRAAWLAAPGPAASDPTPDRPKPDEGDKDPGATGDGGTRDGDGAAPKKDDGAAPKKGDAPDGAATKHEPGDGEPAKDAAPADAPPTGSSADEVPAKAVDAEAVPEALVAAQARLDGLRLRYVKLSDADKAKLRTEHDQRVEAAALAAATPEPEVEVAPEELQTADELKTARDISDAELEAETAAADRERALTVARLAKTEAKRILAEEEARLLGIKGAQALYQAEINRRKAELTQNHDKALEWRRRVAALQDSPKFEKEKALEADPMYDEIRADLTVTRDRLREELERIRNAGADIPTVGEGLDRDLSADIDRGQVTVLRTQLTAHEEALVQLEQEVGWELAQGLRDDVVLLNRTRLLLLERASPGLRSSVTGFGAAGVDQVKREWDQISVELSFHALKIPRYGDALSTRLSGSTIPLLVGGVQVIVVVLAFLWWRRSSPVLLARLETYLRDHRPPSRAYSIGASTLWYLQRFRKPLETLLALWVLVGLVSGLEDLPEINLLWIVALWVLLGLAVILFVDALAAHGTLYSASQRDTSVLRIHSLRVIGLNVIAVGLILSLTSAMVGKGAIYSWCISTCWFLSLPVALYLVYRWQPVIFERIEQRPQQSPFTTWVTSKKSGVVSFPAAAAGAGYLLAVGLGSWTMRQLSGLETTRRLLAYLFRREVAKQAAAAGPEIELNPCSREIYDAFDPEVVPAELLDRVAGKELERVVALAEEPQPTLSAITGERGAGKSTLLARVIEQVGKEKVRVIGCPEAGFDALLAQIAGLTDRPQARGAELYEALRALGPVLIAIDNLQRLVVPAVNGLRGLDDFTMFARAVGGEVSWVVTIGSASWHYIRRARGDRVFFEQVIAIPRWSEEEIGDLIQVQCAAAKVSPSFDGLVVPRQADAQPDEQRNRSEAGYYRLLWDYSNGNPAVALHAFRESLFVTPKGKTIVRLFKQPAASAVEDLPLSILFVLRAIVQLELAIPEEVEAATRLPRTDVEDALRFCLSRHYIEPFEVGVRVTWPWYRTITTVLQRQHLLAPL
jgi:hypothetical protein